ncbi:MAG: nitroreductase family protein [Spirochaetaceae bacterium]|nr:nitroreductase family protein [Myxococcales bacterium]MCB9724707.1 nitroreductase family protein [Spirochaetaceae bacterium]HPG26126.1 nitroreductase family protein [Myxococcota bacterium]
MTGSDASGAGADGIDPDLDAIGETLPLLEGIRTARAIRRLRTDPVPRALIRKVCEAGTFAPSGGNRQPWVFVAVDDAAKRRWVADRYRPIFQRYIGPAIERAEREDFPDHLRRNMKASLHLAEHLHDAPVLLFIAGFTRRGEAQLQALYPCAQNVLLACRAVGLGASFTTLHRAFGEECDRMLGLPERIPSAVMIPIGWPVGRHGVPPRASVDTKLFWNTFDATTVEAERPIR